jgi:hypothetical protein
MRAKRRSSLAACAIAAAALLIPSTALFADSGRHHRKDLDHVEHVLLISIDGMHAVDFANCAAGISGIAGGHPYCPHLAALTEDGVTYLDTSASKPSDSFPGLMAIVAGGSPRSVGAFYDVAYDRSLDPPATTTGNGVVGGPGLCTSGAPPTGTTTEFDEGIDLDQSQLNGGAPSGDGGVNSIDPKKLERDPAHGCAPVYPWNFVRTNTIFGVIHKAGGYTAWSDKHPSYSSVSGPGNMANNLDDYYSPEINSALSAANIALLKGVKTPAGFDCGHLSVDPTKAWTDDFLATRCYDTLKVHAILNEISGRIHDGKSGAPVPNIFGMNFQAVSVGQKLIESGVGTGGYLDAAGTPGTPLLDQIEFVDASIGEMVLLLEKRGLLDSTLIVITAKHGQSPIDPNRYLRITGKSSSNPHNLPDGASPVTILASHNSSWIPASESPLTPNPPGSIGPTEDDISLIWLSHSSITPDAVSELEAASPVAPLSSNIAGIGEIFWGPALTLMFNSPAVDPRSPDIIVSPNVGVIYTGSDKKLSEHGGFAHDDTNVIMLVSNPRLDHATVATPVETAQIAPTILAALGLDPDALQSVRQEGTQLLPGLPFGTED